MVDRGELKESASTPPHLNFKETRPLRRPVEYLGDQVGTGAPTPLDPYAVFVSRPGALLENYIHDAQSRIAKRIHRTVARSNLPDVYAACAEAELDMALDVRVTRNMRSYERLLEKFSLQPPSEAMNEIVERARAGGASPAELLQLIKENPEMISVEFFKRQPMFDIVEYKKVLAELHVAINSLRDTYKDAEISPLKKPIVTTPPFFTPNLAIVWKEKIGDCRSQDSHSEIIVKHTMLMLPTHIQLVGLKDNHKKIGDTTLNLLPIGLSAYFRVEDYQKRGGYISPAEEERIEPTLELLRELGSLANILDTMDPARHATYILAVLSARNRS